MKIKTQEHECNSCLKNFLITNEDIDFYKKVSPVIRGEKFFIDYPKDCPDCRAQNMLSIRNERNLFKRKCDATGKDIISIHKPGNHVTVYNQDYWWGNDRDSKDYGLEYDFSKSFFDQFSDLYRNVPQISLNAPYSEKSEYTNQCQGNKECYIMFCSGDNDNCYYGMWNQNCKYCVDCLYIEYSENCYELFNSKKCYKCFYSKNLDNCTDVLFSRNCNSCSDCIGCVNLQNKSYYILNKQYEKSEYEKKKAELNLGNYEALSDFRKQAEKSQEDFPVKYYNGKLNDRFSGDYVESSKNSYNIYNCRDTEDSNYCRDAWRTVKCYDLVETLSMESSYMLEGSVFVNKCLFGMKLANCNNVLYSSHCNNSHNLFGCIGINNGSYCILNKQYEKAEYETLVIKIIQEMKKSGHWGEYFPISISPFGYNNCVAQEYFPLTKEEATEKGFYWSEYEQEEQHYEKKIKASQLPNTIEEIPDDILNWAIICEETGKLYRITSKELVFYRRLGLPIPHYHHNLRHKKRMDSRNARVLNSIKCKKCSKNILSTFTNDDIPIYCEDCFDKSII